MIFITTYKRPQLLLRLLQELRPDLMESRNGNAIDVRGKDSPPLNKQFSEYDKPTVSIEEIELTDFIKVQKEQHENAQV